MNNLPRVAAPDRGSNSNRSSTIMAPPARRVSLEDAVIDARTRRPHRSYLRISSISSRRRLMRRRHCNPARLIGGLQGTVRPSVRPSVARSAGVLGTDHPLGRSPCRPFSCRCCHLRGRIFAIGHLPQARDEVWSYRVRVML